MSNCSSSLRYDLAREIAEEGIILLKNRKGLLPLVDRTLAVFGRTQVDMIPCGTGSAFCRADYTVNILDGLDGEGISYDKELSSFYRHFSTENSLAQFGVWGSGSHFQPEPMLNEEMVERSRQSANTALFVIGRTAGENDDASADEGDYRLSQMEKEQLDLVCRHFSDVVVVINSGNLIDLSFAERSEIGALLWLSLPGMEGGAALARVLSGSVSPSGRLTDTVAFDYSAYPSSPSFGKKGGLIQPYTEDVFVGYRYFESFDQTQKDVLYPFGFGLSYAEFTLFPENFSYDSEQIHVDVLVKNIGEYAGKETVMLFAMPPAGALPKPKLSLCAFGKTGVLSTGETEHLTLSFPRRSLASFDDIGVTGTKNTWVTEAGKYALYVGRNAKDLFFAGVVSEPKIIVWQHCVPIPTRLSKRLVSYGQTEDLEHIVSDRTWGIPVPPLGECRIETDDLCPSNTKGDYTVKLLVSALGAYRFHFGSDSRVYLGGVEIENGGEAPLAVGESTLTLVGKASPILVEKADDTVLIDEGITAIEGGRFSETALYVVSKPFTDDGLLCKGRGLARMHTPGRYALYTLKVEKAGIYDISLRYSNPYAEMDLGDTFFFLVSNVGQDVESVKLSHTTDDTHAVFQTAAPFSIALPAGECRLKIVSATTTPPEIAYFIVKPSDRISVVAEKRASRKESTPLALESTRNKRQLPMDIGENDLRRVSKGELTVDQFLSSLTNDELATLTCGNSEGQIGYLPKRGVGELLWADGPIGLRLAGNTTIYPASAMLASTWNTSLAERFGEMIGAEAASHGIGVLLAPAVNIHRDPLCGRSFEYYSEDPYLTGKMASAVVRGIQKNPVAATVKHFCANSTEYHRMRSDSYVSARAIREIYVKAFEMIIDEAKPRMIMTSYNLVNGEKVPESFLLCTQIVREELGFDGVLVTDWGNNSDHIRELSAGHDLKMSFGSPERVAAALDGGTLSRQTVENAAHRILTLLLELGN